MSSVPPELTDYIVDYLHDDHASLATCSLVCRNWTATARYHYFSSILLYDVRLCAAFARLLDASPSIGLYVRELHLSKLSSALPDKTRMVEKILPSILARLGRIESLAITLLDLNNIMKAGLTHCESVTNLQLQYCTFPSFEDFVQLFFSFPGLETLTVRGVSWSSTFLDLHPRPGAAPKLRSLVIGGDMHSSDLVDFMILGSRNESITSLSVCCTSEEDATSVGALLEVQGPTLKKLEFEWHPARPTVNGIFLPSSISVKHCTNLEELSLRCVISENCAIPWVTSLLSDLHSTAIKKITLEIRLLADLDALDWRMLDEVLSQARFAHLQSLGFGVALWSGLGMNMVEVQSTIYERLPALKSKGLVHFAS